MTRMHGWTKKKKISAFVAVCVGLMLLAGPAAAQSNEAPTRRSSATFLGDTGLWFVPTAEILPDGKWSASAQRANFDRTAGITDIQHMVATFAYGVKDRVEIFGSFRAVTRIDRDARPLFFGDASIGGPTHQFPFVNDYFTSDVGDLLIGGKFNITSEQNRAPVAFAVRALAKLPTGSDSAGTSTGKLDAAFDAIVSKDLGAAELAAYGGFIVRGDPSEFDLPDSFRYGVGVGIPIGSAVTLFGELNGEALTSDEIRINQVLVATDGSMSGMLSRAQSPADAMVGLQWNAPSGLYVGAGLSASLVHDDRLDAGRLPRPVTDSGSWSGSATTRASRYLRRRRHRHLSRQPIGHQRWSCRAIPAPSWWARSRCSARMHATQTETRSSISGAAQPAASWNPRTGRPSAGRHPTRRGSGPGHGHGERRSRRNGDRHHDHHRDGRAATTGSRVRLRGRALRLRPLHAPRGSRSCAR